MEYSKITNFDYNQFNLKHLCRLILTESWMYDCEIIINKDPPLPDEKIKPACVVRYTYDNCLCVFLKCSDGPLPGYYWGLDGDEMFSPEIAFLSLSKSTPPPLLHPSLTV